MKISLVTTSPDMIEHPRMRQEAKRLGHQFSIVNIQDFNYHILGGRLHIHKLTKLQTDIAIFRAIFHSIKAMGPISRLLRKKSIKIFDNNLIRHQYSINKVTDFIKLGSADLPMPNTHFTRNVQDYLKLAPKLKYPKILKLTKTGKGVGIHKINSAKEFKQLISQQEQQGNGAKHFILQDFIPYEHDLRILIIGRKTFTMKRLPPEGDFRANFSLGGSVEPFSPSKTTIKLARKALSAANLTLGGVDILITPKGKQYVLEVNHTPGMVGMEEATNQNITQHYIKHVLENAK